MELNLSTREFELLSEILDNELKRLRWEICRTDRAAFRIELKAREHETEGLAGKVREALTPSDLPAAALA